MRELLTVDQLAQLLDLHPRTVRRYIREKRVKASKVGGEWRIREEDVEMLIGGRVKKLRAAAEEEVEAFLHTGESKTDGKLQVCAVMDCDVTQEEGVRISNTIMQYMNDSESSHGKAKFQYVYDRDQKKGRYLIWGSPSFIGKLLSAVGEEVQ